MSAFLHYHSYIFVCISHSTSTLRKERRADFNLSIVTNLGEGKLKIQAYLILLENWSCVTFCSWQGLGKNM